MKYCTQCLMPSTKPYLTFNDAGVCSACERHALRNYSDSAVNWKARHEDFLELIDSVKARRAPLYDVLVPVSGGKDSITQIHRILGQRLRILAVNVDYGIKTQIGVRNLSLIPEMGASLSVYRPALDLHKKLVRIGFEDYGDPDLMSHTLLYAYPIHLAIRLGIPLVLHGENAAGEYGGEKSLADLKGMNREYFSKYVANKNVTAADISEKYGIPYESLVLYDFPQDMGETTLAFLSHYYRWDSEKHLEIARSYGFSASSGPGERTYRNYVGMDEKIHFIHQMLKLLKFGYGRATDHACEDIRNGRLSREEAKALVRKHDLKPISEEIINQFTDFIGISRGWYDEVMERYRNRDIWEKNDCGDWVIRCHLEKR